MYVKYSEMFAHNAKQGPVEGHKHSYKLKVARIHEGTEVRQCTECPRWKAFAR